jgi:pimeloyl-ACP methyl ester carboxylesterase
MRAGRMPRRAVIWILAPLALYVLVVGAMWIGQDRLIFVGARWGKGAAVPAVPGVRVERLALPEGRGSFRVAIAEPDAPVGVIVWFVGNGEDIRSGVEWAGLWARYRLLTLVAEYPGYGDSGGTVGVRDFFAAAERLAAEGRARADRAALPLCGGGTSLGTFSAVHLAAHGLVDRLLLRSPPTSLVAAARSHYPWLPVGWLLRHRFDSTALAAQVRCPVLVVHGDLDRVVPQHMGRELAAAFRGPSEFVDAVGFGHNGLPFDVDGPFGARIRKFLVGG